MKKTLVALAALAATGAFAQSTVTLYGTVDAGLAQYRSEGISKTGLYNSQLGSSLVGVKGTEDLGGGLTANFKLEAGLNNDTGAGKGSSTNNQSNNVTAGFGRYSYVGLAGGFGEVRLGRDYTSTFQQTVAAVDPFATNGPANASDMVLNLGVTKKQATVTGASNMIGYITPAMGGFGLKVQGFFGENAGNAWNSDLPKDNAGDGYSLTLSYAKGPIYVAIAQMDTKGAAGALGSGVNGEYKQRGLAASYNFGMAKVVYNYGTEDLALAGGAAATNKSNLLGVVVPFGAFNAKASYVRAVENLGAGDNVGTMVGLGVDYAMSKRTTLYTTVSRVTNDSGTAFSAGSSALVSTGTPTSTGLAIGINHKF